MLALFCLRLAGGLAVSLFLLIGLPVSFRYYRTHFLTILGLSAVAAFLLWANAGTELRLALAAALGLAFAGSIIWSLPTPYGGWLWVGLAAAALGWALAAVIPELAVGSCLSWRLVNSFTSALLLGTALSAMLMGHFYLISPTMSLAPLLRLLAALFAAIGLRAAVAGLDLWFWTAHHSLVNLNDETVLLLPVRWGLGLLAPLVLGWMAWQSARIRSTQSATGILYVVVVFCVLGELISELIGPSAFPVS